MWILVVITIATAITLLITIPDNAEQSDSLSETGQTQPIIDPPETTIPEKTNLFEVNSSILNIERERLTPTLSLEELVEPTGLNIERIRAEQSDILLQRIESFKTLALEVNVLLADYLWGPSTGVEELQSILGLVIDGVYGEETRAAHLAELEIRKLAADNVPNGPEIIKAASSASATPPVAKDCFQETPAVMSCWPGYEGGNESTIEAAFNRLPAPLRNRVPSDVTLVNGCHPFTNRCPYGVMDSYGWGPDGQCCDFPWGRSIWISNRGISSGHLDDIMMHEAFHAVEFLTLSQDVRSRIQSVFGDSERAADGAVAYFGGNWQHYRGSGTGLTESERALFDEIFN